MRVLFRPQSGRVICGVAAGVAERYGLALILVRLFFITAMIVSPLIVLVYLLLAISIPAEARVAGMLRVSMDPSLLPGERFERSSELLSERMLHGGSTVPANLMAVALLIFAAIMELPKVEGVTFYGAHPIVTALATDITKIGEALFFLNIALLFFLPSRRKNSVPMLLLPTRERFGLERREKVLAGIVSGAAEVVELDPAYLRAALIMLNFFTVGLAGAAYLIIWYRYRRRENIATALPQNWNDSHEQTFTASIIIGCVLILLAILSIATQYRLFFFNMPILEGAALAIVGLAAAWMGVSRTENRHAILIGGACLFFIGVYTLALNMGHLQLSIRQHTEMWELIAALAFLYTAIAAMRGSVQKMGFILGLVFAISACLAMLNLAPPRYLAEIERFYFFFYPIIFAALGLWIAFER